MAAVIDSTLPSTSSMVASYENNDAPEEDPMLITIQETTVKYQGLKHEQTEMGSKINYLRDIRVRAMQLLAQADAADEEANRLELEKMTVDKEVDRLKSVIERMEDMRYSTRELTNQMHLDTALQMRHLLANGKNIVPRTTPNRPLKRSISDDNDTAGPAFKVPRKEPPGADSPTAAALVNPAMAGSPATTSSVSKYSPSRQLSLTPGSSGVANYAALAASEAAVSRQSLVGTQQPFVDIPPLPANTAAVVMPAVPVVPVVPTINALAGATLSSTSTLVGGPPPPIGYPLAASSATLANGIKTEPGLGMPPIGYSMVAGVLPTAIPSMGMGPSSMPSMSSGVPMSTISIGMTGIPPSSSPPVMMYGPPGTMMANGHIPVQPPPGGGGGVGMYPSATTALSQKDDLKSEEQFAGDAEGAADGRARDALYR